MKVEIITNQLDWKYDTIAELYKNRWDIKLLFKAIKQNSPIKTFWATSKNAIKTHFEHNKNMILRKTYFLDNKFVQLKHWN
ncbi:MAG: hypothetical protein KAI79_19990 [Bacteroidales bacterium]|nr:hypothetical protein [Bacteroidales bacterium]